MGKIPQPTFMRRLPAFAGLCCTVMPIVIVVPMIGGCRANFSCRSTRSCCILCCIGSTSAARTIASLSKKVDCRSWGLLDAPSASLYAVEVLRGEYAVFPDRLIYQRWCEPGKDRNGRDRVVALTLPTPEQLAAPFAMPVDGLLRDWSELFGGNDESNPHREFRRRFWAEGPYWRHRALLLW